MNSNNNKDEKVSKYTNIIITTITTTVTITTITTTTAAAAAIIIINLIHIFDTSGILTALYIVIKYIQMQDMHIWTYMKLSCPYTLYMFTHIYIHRHTYK